MQQLVLTLHSSLKSNSHPAGAADCRNALNIAHCWGFSPQALVVVIFHSKLQIYFQSLLWKAKGWWEDEKEALTPFLFLIPLLLPLSPSSFPRGGSQPHDSIFLPAGLSVIPLLYFLTSFLFLSILQHFSEGFSQTATCRMNRPINNLGNLFGADFYGHMLRFWPHEMMHSLAANDFGHLSFHFEHDLRSLWFLSQIQAMDLTSFHCQNIPFSSSSPTISLPTGSDSESSNAATETSRHHSDTLQEKDFYFFLLIWFRF